MITKEDITSGEWLEIASRETPDKYLAFSESNCTKEEDKLLTSMMIHSYGSQLSIGKVAERMSEADRRSFRAISARFAAYLGMTGFQKGGA